MQTVSNGDSLHEMSNPVFWEKQEKNIANLLSAELALRVIKVKEVLSRITYSALKLGITRKKYRDMITISSVQYNPVVFFLYLSQNMIIVLMLSMLGKKFQHMTI